MVTTNTSDNYGQITHNGEYGNKSCAVARLTAIPTSATAGSIINLMTLPGGARVVGGMLVIATAVTSSTWHVGVRYADGTSTGGTTGTSVISGTGIAAPVAKVQSPFYFVPFMNDVDTIVYATLADCSAAPGAGIDMAVAIDYIAEGSK